MGEVLGGAGERFIAVSLEEVVLQPLFEISEAGGGGAMGCCRDGLGGEVDLSVIGVAVKTEAMLAKDWTKWENVDN